MRATQRYDHSAGLLARLRRQAEDGTLTLRVAATYPAEQAPEAFLAARSAEALVEMLRSEAAETGDG